MQAQVAAENLISQCPPPLPCCCSRAVHDFEPCAYFIISGANATAAAHHLCECHWSWLRAVIAMPGHQRHSPICPCSPLLSLPPPHSSRSVSCSWYHWRAYLCSTSCAGGRCGSRRRWEGGAGEQGQGQDTSSTKPASAALRAPLLCCHPPPAAPPAGCPTLLTSVCGQRWAAGLGTAQRERRSRGAARQLAVAADPAAAAGAAGTAAARRAGRARSWACSSHCVSGASSSRSARGWRLGQEPQAAVQPRSNAAISSRRGGGSSRWGSSRGGSGLVAASTASAGFPGANAVRLA